MLCGQCVREYRKPSHVSLAPKWSRRARLLFGWECRFPEGCGFMQCLHEYCAPSPNLRATKGDDG
jgi:hypothetical protein